MTVKELIQRLSELKDQDSKILFWSNYECFNSYTILNITTGEDGSYYGSIYPDCWRIELE